MYYTLKAKKAFWEALIAFKNEWNGKYTMADLSRDIGYNQGYVTNVINNEHRGEISIRFVCTAMMNLKIGFHEAFEIVSVDTSTEKYTPSKTIGQLEHADPIAGKSVQRIRLKVHSPDVWRKKFNEQVKKNLTNKY